MSQWIERVKKHAVWTSLDTAIDSIDKANGREGIAADWIDSLERLKAVVLFCKNRLSSTDPVLVVPGVLDAVNTPLTQLSTHVAEFTANGQVDQLAAANANADQMLSNIISILGTITPNDISAIGDVAASYRNSLEKILLESTNSNGVAQKKVELLTASLQELTTKQIAFDNKLNESNLALASMLAEIVEQKKIIANSIAEFNSQFLTAQTERATIFTASETNRQSIFTGAVAEQQRIFLASEVERQTSNATMSATHNEQFTTAQATRLSESIAAAADNQKRFSDAQVERQDSYAILVADYAKKLADQNTDFSNQKEIILKSHEENISKMRDDYEVSAKKIMDKVVEHKLEVEKLVGVIGNTGVTSGYLQTANKAQSSTKVWQGITVFALICLAGGAIYIFNSGKEGWEALASRLLTSLPVIVLAAYAGSQADKYHQIEKRNRKLALELAAIGPYLAPLPTEMQNQFRIEVGGRSFGHQEENHKTTDKSPATALDLLDEISKSDKAKELVISALKAIRGS